MKRMFILLLLLALLLTGCGNTAGNVDTSETPSTTEAVTTEAPTDTPAEPTADAAVVSMPMITVSLPVSSEEVTAEDGTVIFRNTTQNMRLVMPDPEVADRIIIDFLNRIDQITSSGNEILQQAQSAYNTSGGWTPYLCSITYDPMRIDQSVLSLYGSGVLFSGGAHAVFTSHAANYNVVTGDVLTLGSIVVDAEAVDKLCALTIEKLSEIADEKYLREGFEETVTRRFATEESYDEDWYFSTTGLCFYFDPYAIAPYASGVITAEIPYAELVGIMDDAFFPPELEESTGTIITEPAENADMTKFTRISEVVLENEAPMYVIYTDDTVQNLRIILNDAELGSSYTIFAAQTLSSTDAVVIQTNISLFHRLEIAYESNGQSLTMPLLAE